MTDRIVQGSVARIADFDRFEVAPRPRSEWRTGDYVVVRATRTHGDWMMVEGVDGRMRHFGLGDRLMGALGDRAATLEYTGSWREIGDDGLIHPMTPAGLLAKVRSRSPLLPPPVETRYEGHVHVGGEPQNMADFARRGAGRFDLPTILIVGSSMSAGKTATARLLVRRLGALGHRVLGMKLSGAARYRDVLGIGDVGAACIADFVDAGLPSSIVPEEDYLDAVGGLLGSLADEPVDVAVVEAGASPLEPYNGAAVRKLLDHCTRMTVLCVSDPYAAPGIARAFALEPDLVGGVACNTDAGRALIRQLSGFPTIGIFEEGAHATLDELLEARFGRGAGDPTTPLGG
jgi:hypothetical protein